MTSEPASSPIEFDSAAGILSVQNYLKGIFKYLIIALIYLVFAAIIAVVYTGSLRFQTYVKTFYMVLDAYRMEDIRFKFASVYTYPFLAALIKSNPETLLGTAIIIAPQHLIADARCFSSDILDIHVRVGSDFWNVSGTTYLVDAYTIIRNIANKDSLALIVLKDSMTLNTLVQPAKIIWTPPVMEKEGVIVGWLTFRDSLWEASSAISEVRVTVWDDNQCRSYMDDANLVCATTKNQTCNIVSNGPLVLHGSVIGMWYYKEPCVQDRLILHDLYHLKQWLDKFGIKYNSKS